MHVNKCTNELKECSPTIPTRPCPWEHPSTRPLSPIVRTSTHTNIHLQLPTSSLHIYSSVTTTSHELSWFWHRWMDETNFPLPSPPHPCSRPPHTPPFSLILTSPHIHTHLQLPTPHIYTTLLICHNHSPTIVFLVQINGCLWINAWMNWMNKTNSPHPPNPAQPLFTSTPSHFTTSLSLIIPTPPYTNTHLHLTTQNIFSPSATISHHSRLTNYSVSYFEGMNGWINACE